ncbi:MAG: fluoride efflux transporter CrcB [Elusimicrobia bacterium CG11_big_fil_rev_8_21_14_0_20_64_6]|nr:MAG: fluoride efflux transporter CrcB [Elusimicrobia bacterium CG11_big_fil_rev_8_21_14_0_20_64_6]
MNAYAAMSLAAGSLAGGFARYWLSGAVYRGLGTGFPYGTLAVNMLGCFLIGLFDALALERFILSPSTRLLLMTGFCGAFTTLSTLALETSNLMKGGEFGRALLNAAGSVLLGLILLRLGSLAGRLV